MARIKHTASCGPGKFIANYLHTLEDDVARVESSRRERKGMGFWGSSYLMLPEMLSESV